MRGEDQAKAREERREENLQSGDDTIRFRGKANAPAHSVAQPQAAKCFNALTRRFAKCIVYRSKSEKSAASIDALITPVATAPGLPSPSQVLLLDAGLEAPGLTRAGQVLLLDAGLEAAPGLASPGQVLLLDALLHRVLH